MEQLQQETNLLPVNDVLQILETLENSNLYDIYIPSLDRKISFKTLTTEQLKNLLKTVVDSPVYNTEFITNFNKIVKINSADDSINVNNLTIFDKVLIFLKTRIENISSEYISTLSEDEIKQYNLEKDFQFKIDLQKIYDEIIDENKKFEPLLVEDNSISLTCTLPSIGTENKLEHELHQNVKFDIRTPSELREVIGNTFINEVTKYVAKLSIDGKELDLTQLDFKKRIKIVEKIPTTIIKNVLAYIESYKKYVSNKLTITRTVKDVAGTDVTINKEIPFDASFFNA